MSSDSANADQLTIGIAGTGIFAQKAHRPALEKSPFKPMAVFSRDAGNASRFVASLSEPQGVQSFTDFDRFLASERFTAIDLVLPTPAIGGAIRQALQAGKHVLSEKPVAASVAKAADLIQWWRNLPAPPVWLVSENWRLEPAFTAAAGLVADGVLGDPLQINCECIVFRRPDSPYESGWRTQDTAPAAWLTDIGPHAMAALSQVSGRIDHHLAANLAIGEDRQTVMASLRFASGLPGYLSLTRASGPTVDEAFDIVVHVLGSRGRLRVDRTGLQVHSLAGEERMSETFSCYTVNAAIDLFAQAVASHNVESDHPLHPHTALQDLVAIERIQQML